MGWTNEDQTWIKSMNDLFDNLFGPGYCCYEFTKTKHCVLVPGQLPVISYNHDEWEKNLGSVDREEVKEDETVVKPVSFGGKDEKLSILCQLVEKK